jgi:hypothetical protein
VTATSAGGAFDHTVLEDARKEEAMENVAVCASRIRSSLASLGSLNLWEVKAILNESRDTAFQVLLWMASRKEIAYSLQDETLCVTLAGAAGKGGGSWKSHLSVRAPQ